MSATNFLSQRTQRLFFASFAFSFALLRCAASVSAEVRAGAAHVEFALPEGVPLAGYSRRHGAPSRGLHDPVGVRALVLEEGAATVALVSCDVLIIDEHLADAVRQHLIAEGLPSSLTLVLAATHTHSGPGAYGTRFLEKLSMGHFDSEAFEAIVEAAVDAVVTARDMLAPVRLAYGTAQTSGLAANRVDPRGFADGELTVVGFFARTGSDPLAVLVNFSAHPTVLGAWNRQLSADYPGAIVRALEQRYPSAVALFFAGSVADQAPVKSGDPSTRPGDSRGSLGVVPSERNKSRDDAFARVEAMGQALARGAIAVLDGARPQPPAALRARQERLLLPPAQVRLGRLTLPRWLGSSVVDDDATLSLIAVGPAVFFGVPCDLASAFGLQLKRAARAQGLQPMVIGFAGDYIGYCVPAALYEEKKYESSMAFNGPQAGALVVERLIQMLSATKSDQ